MSQTLSELQRSKRTDYKFLKEVDFSGEQIHMEMMQVNPSPTEILTNLCEVLLRKNVSTIIYLTNSELFGRSTASSQYFLQVHQVAIVPKYDLRFKTYLFSYIIYLSVGQLHRHSRHRVEC